MFNCLRRRPTPAAPGVDEIARAVAAGDMLLLDVRDAAEVQKTGKARGALHVPLSLLALKADPQAPDAALAPGRPVAVYCAMGGRAGKAVEVLQRLGYDPVWNIGGLGDWTRAGGQVERA